jgi:uncharacterized membrane protein (DUF373 family)
MRLLKKVVDIIIKLMIPLIILALMIGMARMFIDLRLVFDSPTAAGGFTIMVANILSMLIVMELLKSIIEYFEVRRFKITFIIDAGLIFVLREVMIGIYQHKIGAFEIASFAILLLVLGSIRALAVVYSPDKKEVIKHE